MASAFQFGFANPDNFSDWAQYAGFDRKTGMMAPPDIEPQGVEPPKNIGEWFENKVVKPLQNIPNKIQQFGTNLQNALPTLQQNVQSAQQNMMPGQQNVQSTGWQLHNLMGD